VHALLFRLHWWHQRVEEGQEEAVGFSTLHHLLSEGQIHDINIGTVHGTSSIGISSGYLIFSTYNLTPLPFLPYNYHIDLA
jgi:hypothetical protein